MTKIIKKIYASEILHAASGEHILMKITNKMRYID